MHQSGQTSQVCFNAVHISFFLFYRWSNRDFNRGGKKVNNAQLTEEPVR